MTALWQRFRALPRASRWLIVFVAFIGLYFGAIEPLLDAMRRYNFEADRIETDLSQRQETRERILNTAGELERSMIAFGRPAFPAKGGDPQTALDKRLSQVLNAHGIRETRRNIKEPVPIPGPRGTPARFNRLVIELTFECDTTKLLAVLKDLEKAPEVTAIARLSVRKLADPGPRGKGDSGMLQVQVSPETWVLAAANAEKAQ